MVGGVGGDFIQIQYFFKNNLKLTVNFFTV